MWCDDGTRPRCPWRQRHNNNNAGDNNDNNVGGGDHQFPATKSVQS